MSKIWYPYAQHKHLSTPLEVTHADGVFLTLSDGHQLIDGISSWWSTIHGYNHPRLNKALTSQLNDFSHVMLGGLTHAPAQNLASCLIDITPEGLNHVFYADSGSVGCEVALKLAIQFWHNKGRSQKTKFLALNRGYHGDTCGVMSVGNPEDDCPSMHRIFSGIMPSQYFVSEPKMGFNADPHQLQADLDQLTQMITQHHDSLAGFILEPIMQGAGGFNFYSPDYLRAAYELCKAHDVLLICDEVATGFGRTGTLFASNHANITPDIMVLGKALTAGYTGHSATLTTSAIFDQFWSDSFQDAFMHGPTFMGNPLACAVAYESIQLFQEEHMLDNIKCIDSHLQSALLSFEHDHVIDTRVLGAVGVIEVSDARYLKGFQDYALRNGVWLRPFDRYLYTTPPYCISLDQLSQVTSTMTQWFSSHHYPHYT